MMFSVIIIYVIISTIWHGTNNREALQFQCLLTDNPSSPGEAGHTTEVYIPPPLFSNSGAGTFTSHKNQISEISVRRDLLYGFSSLSEKTRKSNRLQMSLQRQHFLFSLTHFEFSHSGNTFFSLSHSDPECWFGRGLNPRPSRLADQRSPNWDNQAAVCSVLLSVTLECECSLI